MIVGWRGFAKQSGVKILAREEANHSKVDDLVFALVEASRLDIEQDGRLGGLADGRRERRPGHQATENAMVPRLAQRLGHLGQTEIFPQHHVPKKRSRKPIVAALGTNRPDGRHHICGVNVRGRNTGVCS